MPKQPSFKGEQQNLKPVEDSEAGLPVGESEAAERLALQPPSQKDTSQKDTSQHPATQDKATQDKAGQDIAATQQEVRKPVEAGEQDKVSEPNQTNPDKGNSERQRAMDSIDEAAWESFPASDPPSYTGSSASRSDDPTPP